MLWISESEMMENKNLEVTDNDRVQTMTVGLCEQSQGRVERKKRYWSEEVKDLECT